jgi:hypothetical protein
MLSFLLIGTLTSLPLSVNLAFAENTLTKDITIQSATGGNATIAEVIYSDAFFSSDSSNYVQDLAKLSLAFSTAAYESNPTLIEKALSDFNFTNDTVYDKGSYQSSLQEGSNTVGYSFASKKISVASKNYTLIAVVVRGTSGDNEWISNFNINNSGTYPSIHEGFSKAEKSLLASLNSYVNSLKLDKSNTKFLITGHSRGAAVANLLAADLSETEQLADQSNIYGYTFATPNVAKIGTDNYSNIFNAVNSTDIITEMPLAKWGYSKYGINYNLPDAAQINTADLETAQELLLELESMAPTVQDFYKNKLSLLLFQGGFLTTVTSNAHSPMNYMNSLKEVDSEKLSEQILDLQLELVPDRAYA